MKMRRISSDEQAMRALYKMQKLSQASRFQITSNPKGVGVFIRTTDERFSATGEYKKKYSAKTLWEAYNLHIGNIK